MTPEKKGKRSRKSMGWAVMRSAVTGLLEDKLRAFNEHFWDVERMYARSKKKLEKAASEEQLDGSPDGALEFYGEMISVIDSTFLRTFRSCMLVSLYSVVENSLRHLCGHLRKKTKAQISLNEINGQGIWRAKVYLEKVCGLKLPAKGWSDVIKLNRIRNCVVHAEGSIKACDNPTKLKNIIEHDPALSIDHFGNMQIMPEYIEKTLKDIEVFLMAIYSEAFD
ncbi:hypothetical protein ACFLQU_05080 [Verrucomicrobiota bacterium]